MAAIYFVRHQSHRVTRKTLRSIIRVRVGVGINVVKRVTALDGHEMSGNLFMIVFMHKNQLNIVHD
jgi:hypothetical protein